jgi:hypothetical protein
MGGEGKFGQQLSHLVIAPTIASHSQSICCNASNVGKPCSHEVMKTLDSVWAMP